MRCLLGQRRGCELWAITLWWSSSTIRSCVGEPSMTTPALSKRSFPKPSATSLCMAFGRTVPSQVPTHTPDPRCLEDLRG